MGQCPCWGSRKKSSYNPFIYDEDYLEYDNSDKSEPFNTYRPPAPISQQQRPVNSHTSTISTSPYSSSPNTSALSQQPADFQICSTHHPQDTSHIPQQDSHHIVQQHDAHHIVQQQDSHHLVQPHFTHYTESVFLSRPNQPTESMMADSMMDSTILGLQHHVADSGMIDSSMMMNNSGAESSVYYDAPSSSFIANSVHAGAFEPPSPPLEHTQQQQQQK